eukprot:662027-Pelagomonas_calceolata.AAC.9
MASAVLKDKGKKQKKQTRICTCQGLEHDQGRRVRDKGGEALLAVAEAQEWKRGTDEGADMRMFMNGTRARDFAKVQSCCNNAQGPSFGGHVGFGMKEEICIAPRKDDRRHGGSAVAVAALSYPTILDSTRLLSGFFKPHPYAFAYTLSYAALGGRLLHTSGRRSARDAAQLWPGCALCQNQDVRLHEWLMDGWHWHGWLKLAVERGICSYFRVTWQGYLMRWAKDHRPVASSIEKKHCTCGQWPSRHCQCRSSHLACLCSAHSYPYT